MNFNFQITKLKKLEKLKKSTNQKSGIISSKYLSILFFFLILFNLIQPVLAGEKKFEIQFFATNLREELNYNKLKDYNIDKIIIRNFQNKDEPKGLLFRNTNYNTIEPLLENLLIEKNIEKKFSEVPNLWAWMITRNFNWVTNVGLFDYKYSRGSLESMKKYDLFNKNAVKKIIGIYKEIAINKIDGILIQDDLIIKYNEGMSEYGTKEFERVTGVPANMQKMILKGNYYNSEWIKIKKKKIIEVLSKIIREVKQINPDIKIGMNIYYETPLFIENAEQWYSHNLKNLVKTDIDYIYLMSYQRQIKDEMKLTEKENKNLFEKIVKEAFKIAKEKLIVKIQIYDWKSKKRVSKREIIKYIKLIPKGVKRICFTPVKLKDIIFIKKIIRKVK